ncbi:hypothetical protein [Massilia sp. BKSP1R2A-1]|uniref:RIFT barrel domain-containing protein n=1 Tax=Massilia sp. BKSP1R2A-1 TaxID=3422595 RepID=UPI003D325CC7
MLISRLIPFFLSAALLCETHARSLADAPKGLPAGGGLDAGRVIELRYGTEPSATADKPRTPVRPAPAPTPAPPAAIPGALATLSIENSSTRDQADVPVTFGQVFGVGEFKAGQQLRAKLADGSTLPVQTDVKAHHPDGSVRHAVVSLVLERLAHARPVAVGLFADAAPDERMRATTLPGKELDARVEARIDGKTWTASLRPLLEQGKPVLWLDGPLAREWLVSTPLLDAGGRSHPHLAARFALRWYPLAARARIDVTVENNWAYEPAPQNFVYDARIVVGKDEVYSREKLNHYHHARWRKLFWWGGEPVVNLRHDTSQLIASKALPNYDQSVRIDEKRLARMYASWGGEKTAPMGVGMAVRAMATTGGRPDIGLLPGWAAMYLLGMDPRAREITLGTADLAGSWSIHYRDRRTGMPVSLVDYPFMTIRGSGGDTLNPATGKREAFPDCAARDACTTPNKHDTSHQPAFSYLPYLLTGDHYHLEELQFWAMYNVFMTPPGYRQDRKGLLAAGQVRGQAWSLRSLGEAAYITPDAHPLKRHFLQILDSNLDWYNATYPRNPQANVLGALVNGYALAYEDKRGLAPWQDDFFTSAVGHVAELGFGKAHELLRWKATFPVQRMIGDGACWLSGAMYKMMVRDNASAPFYRSMAQAYRASMPPEVRDLPCDSPAMATALGVKSGQMTGYSNSATGFPSNMQPALAYAADALGEPGRKAWRQFMARSVKPDYGLGPQFAIVPRSESGGSEKVEQR